MSLMRSLLVSALLGAVPFGTVVAQTPPAGEVADETAEPTPAPVAEAPPPATDGTEREGLFIARFDEDLYQVEPLMLYGIRPERYIPFHIPPSWELTGPVELVLRLDHSETLLGKFSSLSVTINNHAIGGTFLDESNVVDGELRLQVKQEYLRPYNQIRIAAVQHYTTDCEDPFDPNLWSRIQHASELRIPYRRQPVEADLVQLPGPFFEEHGISKVYLDLVTSDPVSEPAVRALTRLGFSFGRLSDYRGLEVESVLGSVREARRHAILVGLIDDHPEIRELIGDADVGQDEGLVALVPNPADPTLAVLVVTGRSDTGLQQAVFAVAGDDRHEILSGSTAIVRSVEPSYPTTQRNPLPPPPTRRFTVKDLGLDDRSVRGFYADPVVIPLMFEGDAQVRPSGGELELDFSYSSQLDTRIATVEVGLDGVMLASRPLDRVEGEQHAKLRVHLPRELVKPHAKLIVQFHLFPESFDACERVSDRIVWGTVHADTTVFEVPRDQFAEMPDLSRLRYDMWPYTTAGEQGAVTIVAPDSPGRYDAAAVFQVAATLGWHRSVDVPNLDGTTGTGVGGSVPDRHLIVLQSDAPNAVYKALQAAGALRNDEPTDTTHRLIGTEGLTIDGRYARTYGYFEQLQHPAADSRERSILVMHSEKGAGVLELARTLMDPEMVQALDGNITVVPEANPVSFRVIDNAPLIAIGSQPLESRVTLMLARYWPFFGFLLLGAALMFSLVVSLWARRNGAHT
jgi:hypothetical protein